MQAKYFLSLLVQLSLNYFEVEKSTIDNPRPSLLVFQKGLIFMENDFKEELKNIITPYLNEPVNVDFLVYKIMSLVDKYYKD